MKKLLVFSVMTVLVVAVALIATDAQAQMKMKMPKMEKLSGTLIDLTCASKGHATMGNWYNAENNDHMTEDGKKEQCATMCLQGGQPAALFADNKIEAVFACNPKATLSNYAAQSVDVQGFWAVDSGQRAFVPTKIKAQGGDWQDVNCATMH